METWKASMPSLSAHFCTLADFMAMEPQKAQGITETLEPGLEHRPFTDEEIKEAFNTFDLDNNRFVGAAEITHILKLIGEDVTANEIDEMIRMCDSDGDGQVTFDEFFKMMTTPPAPLPPAAAAVAGKKKGPGGSAKRYARSLTGADSALAAQRQMELSGNKGNWKAQQAAAASAKEQRSLSVETLIKKLSGGMGKIKPSQIKKIYKRFQDIDVDGSGDDLTLRCCFLEDSFVFSGSTELITPSNGLIFLLLLLLNFFTCSG